MTVGISTYLLIYNWSLSTEQYVTWCRRPVMSPSRNQTNGSIFHSLLRTNQSDGLCNFAKSNVLFNFEQCIVIIILNCHVEIFMSNDIFNKIDKTASVFFSTTNTNGVITRISMKWITLEPHDKCNLKLTYVTQCAAVRRKLSEIIVAPHLWSPSRWSNACHGTWVILTRNPPITLSSGMWIFSTSVNVPVEFNKNT